MPARASFKAYRSVSGLPRRPRRALADIIIIKRRPRACSAGRFAAYEGRAKARSRKAAGGPASVPSLACKPGSVVYGHLSGRSVAGAFERCWRHAPGGQPMRLMPNLAPDGVCTARPVTGAPVSSYLPFPSLQQKRAVCFCCTFLGVASTGRYPASCPAVPGLSSWQTPRDRTANSEHDHYRRRARVCQRARTVPAKDFSQNACHLTANVIK